MPCPVPGRGQREYRQPDQPAHAAYTVLSVRVSFETTVNRGGSYELRLTVSSLGSIESLGRGVRGTGPLRTLDRLTGRYAVEVTLSPCIEPRVFYRGSEAGNRWMK
ncbi:hypothetical protein TWF103_003397 [Orbilia oligospora]|nr:hypothetical protein TWF103_003397 [Orbilia oligospora]